MGDSKQGNLIVKPIPIPAAKDARPVKGGALVSECFANILACARKKSGKTTVVRHTVNECAVPGYTTVFAFASTIDKDDNWLAIRKELEDKGVAIVPFNSIHEDGVDQLAMLVQQLQTEAKAEQVAKEAKKMAKLEGITKPPVIRCDEDDEDCKEDKPKKKKKLKYRAPKYIIVLDDLSDELKSKSLVKLLKMNRHFQTKVIVSTQYLKDLLPEQIKQFDVILLFRDLTDKQLEHLFTHASLSVKFSEFLEMYKKATSEPYGFLYVDTREDKFRTNFDRPF